jgi:hypothetical protein
MKNAILGMLLGVTFFSCQENESVLQKEFTGNEAVYPLDPGTDHAVSGSVIFKEKTDGTTVIAIQVSATEKELKHPVHLHLGDITLPGADIVALLNPVEGSTGQSETHLVRLADESIIGYQDLLKLQACIKIHLAAFGPDRDIILAGGNIGPATPDNAGGRSSINVCKSE